MRRLSVATAGVTCLCLSRTATHATFIAAHSAQSGRGCGPEPGHPWCRFHVYRPGHCRPGLADHDRHWLLGLCCPRPASSPRSDILSLRRSGKKEQINPRRPTYHTCQHSLAVSCRLPKPKFHLPLRISTPPLRFWPGCGAGQCRCRGTGRCDRPTVATESSARSA